MINFCLGLAAVAIGMYLCIKVGEDNIKNDLRQTLIEELEEIDIGDPTAHIKTDLIERIGNEVL